METVILLVEKNQIGLFEASNGCWNFCSEMGESMDEFQIRLTRHFLAEMKQLWFHFNNLLG
ncbi:hypothetical protein MCERE19_02232 [Spirosomataceae bacterium]|jgi:hypothetical protein